MATDKPLLGGEQPYAVAARSGELIPAQTTAWSQDLFEDFGVGFCSGMLTQGQPPQLDPLASRVHGIPTPLPIEFARDLMEVTYLLPP
jgi:hypothetical protein